MKAVVLLLVLCDALALVGVAVSFGAGDPRGLVAVIGAAVLTVSAIAYTYFYKE